MDTLLSKKFLIPTFIISILYIIFSIYLMNFGLVRDTIFGSFSVVYKFNLLGALLEGMWTAMTHIGLFTLIATGILTGANISLLSIKLKALGGLKNTHLVVGGSSLLGIVGSGCAACGLPIISFLGLSGSIIYLPFHGTEIAFLAVALLSFSFFMLLRSSKKTKVVCAIPEKKPTPVVHLAIEKTYEYK